MPYVPAHVDTAPPCSGTQPCGSSIPGANEALTYTTAPLQSDVLIAGMVRAQLYASFDRQEGSLALTLWDIAPDGTGTVVTQGWLRASLRAINTSLTTYGPCGYALRPYHPLTRDSKLPVAGTSNEYLVELNPVSARFASGHRIRLSVSITDGTLLQSSSLNAETMGETVFLSRGLVKASNLLLPIVSTASQGNKASAIPAVVGQASERCISH